MCKNCHKMFNVLFQSIVLTFWVFHDHTHLVAGQCDCCSDGCSGLVDISQSTDLFCRGFYSCYDGSKSKEIETTGNNAVMVLELMILIVGYGIVKALIRFVHDVNFARNLNVPCGYHAQYTYCSSCIV